MRWIAGCWMCAVALVFMGARTTLADAPATQPSSPRVLVRGFDVIGDEGHHWVGSAIQEGISSGLQQAGMTEIKSDGQSTDADFVISGTCQLVNDEIRITGQVTDVHTGKSVGGLHCQTGLRQLFDSEDALASQAERLIRPAPRAAANKALPPPAIDMTVSIQAYQPRYFDGNLQAELAVPDAFQAQRDHYNYSQFPCCYGCYGCGYGYGCGAYAGAGSRHYPIATPINTW